MPTFKLEVSAVKMETPSIGSIKLALSGQALNFKPGQYCLVSLKVGDQSEDRALSIANSPTRGGSVLFATRRSESPYKRCFFDLKPGDSVTLTGPMGRFIYDETSQRSVFLSGGIGITPLKSMMEYAIDRGLEHHITLLFGNRSLDEIPFRVELDEWARIHKNLSVVHVVSRPQGEGDRSWAGPQGRINEALLRQHINQPDQARYFLCGSPGMVSNLKELLSQMSIPGDQIVVENFNGYE